MRRRKSYRVNKNQWEWLMGIELERSMISWVVRPSTKRAFVIRPLNPTPTRPSSTFSRTSHQPRSDSVPHAVFLGGISCQSSYELSALLCFDGP